MARKVINTTHAANRYDILSQTPKNYNKDNYFLKELQEKVNADWPYRPNRVDIEFENAWGKQTYSPIEVVIQSVRSEKGIKISDDCKMIVFRDILEKRFVIGSRFRFGDFTGQHCVEETNVTDRNIWLGVNMNTTNMTAAMVVERCSGVLGSIWINPETGLSERHYEPAILPQSLSSVSLLYDDSIVQEDADVMAIVQTNEFTRKYFVNQRFILGYGAERKQVYRIKSIHDFYSSITSIDDSVEKSQGLTRLYLEITETSPEDDFEHRIAAQSVGSPVIVQPSDEAYQIQFINPEPMPAYLGDSPIVFTPQLVSSGGAVVSDVPFVLNYSLQNLPTEISASQYVDVKIEDGNFTLTRKRSYLGGDLELVWQVDAEHSPTQANLEFAMQLGMGRYS
ncbi:MAG: hypothetical protein J6S67_07560 [Methanobrevibacter sp.]|nr:hypothetical protein [Methanobrevibacter sp.]